MDDTALKDFVQGISDYVGDDVSYFDGLVQSIIGVSTDGAIIYSEDDMIQEFMSKNNWTETEAIEWIDKNVIPCIPYMSGIKPIIMHTSLALLDLKTEYAKAEQKEQSQTPEQEDQSQVTETLDAWEDYK